MSTHYQRGADGRTDMSETYGQRMDYQRGQSDRLLEESKRNWDRHFQREEAQGEEASRREASRFRTAASGSAAPPMALGDWVRAGMLFGAIGLAGYGWYGGLVQSWSQLASWAVAGGFGGAVAGAVLYVLVAVLKIVLRVMAVVFALLVAAVVLSTLLRALGIWV